MRLTINLSPRARYHVLLFLGPFTGMAIIGSLAFLFSKWIALLTHVYMVLLLRWIGRIRCPSCGAPLIGGYKVLGFHFRSQIIVSRYCKGCGYDLSIAKK